MSYRGMARVTRDQTSVFALSWMALAGICLVAGVASLVTGRWIGTLFFAGAAVCLAAHFGTNAVSRRFARKAEETGE